MTINPFARRSTKDTIAILSLVLQMVVTLTFVITIAWQVINSAPLPENIVNLTLLTLGYWFGKSTRTEMTGEPETKGSYNGG